MLQHVNSATLKACNSGYGKCEHMGPSVGTTRTFIQIVITFLHLHQKIHALLSFLFQVVVAISLCAKVVSAALESSSFFGSSWI